MVWDDTDNPDYQIEMNKQDTSGYVERIRVWNKALKPAEMAEEATCQPAKQVNPQPQTLNP